MEKGSKRMQGIVHSFQPLASIVQGRQQKNEEYYVTYSSSFNHENPCRLLYLIDLTDFATSAFPASVQRVAGF